ncbi:MAG: hypothetical protein IPP46_19250 [Bacteroidetes bacterium]|nr:hypothetical protein [Bacteroidota bacterium]
MCDHSRTWGFVANTRSAFLNPAQHTFSPPSRKLAFNASLRTNDGLLAHHLSKRSGITYGEALTEIKYLRTSSAQVIIR